MNFTFPNLEIISDIPQHWTDRVRNQIYRFPLQASQTKAPPYVYAHTMGTTLDCVLTKGVTPFRLKWAQKSTKSPQQPHQFPRDIL